MNVWRPIVAAIVAALLFATYLADRSAIRGRERAEGMAQRIVDFDETEATRVELRNPSGTYVLERRDDGWWIVEPRELRADGGQVRALIDNVRGAKRAASFPLTNPAEYGLDHPTATLRMLARTADGPRDVTLELGAETPQVGRVFARLAGEDAGFTTGDWVRNQALKDLAVLRDKAMVGMPSESLSRVAIQGPSESITLRRDDNSTGWKYLEADCPADADKLSRAMALLDWARALGIDDSPTTPAFELGLEPPVLRIAFAGAQGEEELRIGRRVTGRDEFYATSTRQPSVATVRASAVADWFHSGRDWKSKAIFWTPKDRIVGVQTASGDARMHMRRDADGTWRFVEMPDLPTHPGKVENFLNAITSIKAQRFTAAEASDPDVRRRYGFHRANLVLTVEADDGTTEGLLLGQTNPAENTAYVERARDGAIVGVDFGEVEGIFKFRPDLSDRRIRSGIARRAERLEILTGVGVRIVIARKAGVWRIDVPGEPTRVLPEGGADLVLRRLEELEWETQLGTPPTVEPTEVYRLLDADGNPLVEYSVMKDEFDKMVLGTGDEYYYPNQQQFAQVVAAITKLIAERE